MSDIAAYMNEATQTARVIDGLASGSHLRPIHKVGIIGAGTMGGGIAMNFATAGIQVILIETKEEALTRGLGVIQANYHLCGDRVLLPCEEVASRFARIDGGLVMAALAD